MDTTPMDNNENLQNVTDPGPAATTGNIIETLATPGHQTVGDVNTSTIDTIPAAPTGRPITSWVPSHPAVTFFEDFQPSGEFENSFEDVFGDIYGSGDIYTTLGDTTVRDTTPGEEIIVDFTTEPSLGTSDITARV